MKIDPVFPSAPVLNPPRYKFTPKVASPLKVVEQESDEVVVPEEGEVSGSSDERLLLLLIGILCLVVLFS